MVDLLVAFQIGFVNGVILSILLGLLLAISLYINAEIWVNDYPPDIRQQFGPKSDKAKKQGIFAVIPFSGLLLGAIILTILQLDQSSPGEPSFLPVFLAIFTMLMVFNLVDLLILDWLLFVTVRPDFIILPGTEGMKGYGDYYFHFRGFLTGCGLILGAGLICALVTSIIYLIL